MRIKDLRDLRDLRELSTNDVVDLAGELREIAAKRGLELLGQGKVQARRAIGAPGEGAVPLAVFAGIALGLVMGAIFASLATPVRGQEARRKLREQAGRLGVGQATVRGDGQPVYERATANGAVGASATTAGMEDVIS